MKLLQDNKNKNSSIPSIQLGFISKMFNDQVQQYLLS